MADLVGEDPQALGLLDAQQKAAALFDEVERTLIRPGISEGELNAEIHALGEQRFGITAHWHKRLVRTGPNTLLTYRADPADLVIQADDILFVDLGPVFEAWEADFGRTFVLGNDPHKHDLRNALEEVFHTVKDKYQAKPDMTCAELYALAAAVSREAGWEFGGEIAGHLVGAYPHEENEEDPSLLYVRPGNETPINSRAADGGKRHWILEVHLVDRERRIGGFYEDLLTAG
jgi:Xaa-Pro aminopeptidase